MSTLNGKFTLRVKPQTPSTSGSLKRRLSNPNNAAEAKVARKRIRTREQQLVEAVEWCREHNCRGYSAVKSKLFPLVKDRRTIDKRLDGKIITGQEKNYCSILLPSEEEFLVEYVKNKIRTYQGVGKAPLTELILKTLKIRDHLNKQAKGGRKYKALSKPAKDAIKSERYLDISNFVDKLGKVQRSVLLQGGGVSSS